MRETFHDAAFLGIEAGAAFFGQLDRGLVGFAAQVLEQTHVPRLGHGRFKGDVLRLQEGVEAHQAEADRALTDGGIDGVIHRARRALDEIFQHVVEEAHDVFDEARLITPFEEGFGIDRRQAADGGAVAALVIDAGVQHDFRAQVRLADLQAQVALVRRHGAVHRVGEDQVGLAGLQADFEDLLPQRTRVDEADDLVVLRRTQAELGAFAHGFHEFVGDADAVVQIQRFAVEVARSLADFEELFDFGVEDIDIDGGRSAAQGALRNGESQRIHNADEGDDAGGLAGALDLFTDRADAAPVGANAAAV